MIQYTQTTRVKYTVAHTVHVNKVYHIHVLTCIHTYVHLLKLRV